MTFIKPFLTARTKVGIAVETTAGDFHNPFKWIPVASAKLESTPKYFEDKAYRGRASESYGHYRLVRTGTAEYAGPLYPDSSSFWFLSAFGQDKITTKPAQSATDLNGATLVGATVILVDATTGFVVGTSALIDDSTKAKREWRRVTAVDPGVSITVAALTFAHADETPVVAYDALAADIAKGGLTATLLTGQGANYVPGEAVLIGVGSLMEGNVVKSILGDVLTLELPWRFAHNHLNGNEGGISGNNLHEFRLAPNDRNDATIGGNSVSPGEDVPHLSISDFFNVTSRQIPGATVEELAIKWSAQSEASYTVKLVGMALQPATFDPATSSFTRKAPFIGWQAGMMTADLGSDATINAAIEDMEIAIKRKVEVIFAGNNDDSPSAIVATTMGVSGKFTAVFNNQVEYSRFENGQTAHIRLVLAGVSPNEALTLHTAAGLVIDMAQVTYVKVPIERGKDYVQVMVEFAADDNYTIDSPDTVGNGADNDGPAMVRLTNDYATLMA